MVDETLGSRIKRLRQLASPRITQAALATPCGISRAAVNQWELDRTTPSGKNLLTASRVLGVSPDYLLSGEGGALSNSTLDETLLLEAISDALDYMASVKMKVEDNPSKFAEIISIQYHIQEQQGTDC